jgi:hypothetical protein
MTDRISPLLEKPPRKIPVEEALRITDWSRRTFDRHRHFFKTYLLAMPGKTRGRRLVDYEDFCRYLEQRAQGLTNPTPEEGVTKRKAQLQAIANDPTASTDAQECARGDLWMESQK